MTLSDSVSSISKAAIEKEIKEQLESLMELHKLFNENEVEITHDDPQCYQVFLDNLNMIEGTIVQKCLPKSINKVLNKIINSEEPDDQGEKLSEINFVIGAISDQMDDAEDFEESCQILANEKGYDSWYRFVCLMGGFDGEEEEDDEGELTEEQLIIFEELTEQCGLELFNSLYNLLDNYDVKLRPESDINKSDVEDYCSGDLTFFLQRIIPERYFETYIEPFGAYTKEELLSTYPDVWKAAAKITNGDLKIAVSEMTRIEDEEQVSFTLTLNGNSEEYYYDTNSSYIDQSIFEDIQDFAEEYLPHGFFFDPITNDLFTSGVYLPKELIPVFQCLLFQE